MTREQKIALGIGSLAVGVYLFMKRRTISELASRALQAGNDAFFRASLPDEAVPYADVIKAVALAQRIDPLLLAAIGMQESGWGVRLSPPGPGGTGDNGHGHGIMQIDDRTWGEWLQTHDWTDPHTNVSKGAEIYLANEDFFRAKGVEGDMLVRAALAAYNAGPGNVWAAMAKNQDPDTVTYRGNYSQSVTGYLRDVATRFASLVGAGPPQV